MRFSVILPIYNVENYLAECVESILAQTFSDYEIILVDDGSTDSSPKICDDYAGKYDFIRAIHKKNGGPADTRNEGAKAAQGEYLVYLDSDDFLLSNRFLEELNELAKGTPDLIFYKYVKFFDDAKQYGKCGFSYQSAMGADTYSKKIEALVKADAFYGMAWVRATRRALLEQNNIQFEVGLSGEDMDWNYSVISHSESIAFLDEPMVAYRQRSGSITNTYKFKNLDDYVSILEKWSKKIEEETKDETLKAALLGSLAKHYSNLMVVYARLKDKKKKECKKRIQALRWLLKYGMSRRPQTVAKIYRLCGFDLTIFALKILDRIKH